MLWKSTCWKMFRGEKTEGVPYVKAELFTLYISFQTGILWGLFTYKTRLLILRCWCTVCSLARDIPRYKSGCISQDYLYRNDGSCLRFSFKSALNTMYILFWSNKSGVSPHILQPPVALCNMTYSALCQQFNIQLYMLKRNEESSWNTAC